MNRESLPFGRLFLAILENLCYCEHGATDKRQAGGSPPRFAEGHSFFCPPTHRKGGQRLMVTYSELFQFCILMVSVISLVIKVCNSKKK